MDENKRQRVAEEVLGEESCATCKYWDGRWRGAIYSDTIKEWNSYGPNDTYSFRSEGSQFTYGECRRFPPTQSSVDKVRKYRDQIRWERWLDAEEKSYDEVNERLNVLEEEKEEAEKTATEHPEIWDRQMAEAKVAKLEKEIRKLERRQEENEWWNHEKQSASLEKMAPKESVRRGVWPTTTNYGWCGEYRRDKEKTDLLIWDLCDRDPNF